MDDWNMLRKGKGLLAKNVELSNKWVPTGNRFGPIDALTQTFPVDDVLVEEVDGGSIIKHKTDMDHIIHSDLSTSSMNIRVNTLLDSLVIEAPPKGNHTLVHYDEGSRKKGDEILPLVVMRKRKFT